MRNYKRLTERTKHGIAVLDSGERFVLSCGGYATTKALNRLAELEDKIENGTLAELPCKVGDVMYEVIDGIPIQEWKIESICFDRAHPTGVIWAERTRDLAHWKFWIEDCGTKWFITKTEAEKRLEEIRNKNEN